MQNKMVHFFICYFLLASFDIRAAEPLLKNVHDSPDNWRRTVTPFKIADHTWYIGTEGLTANSGAILIDGGVPSSAEMLLKNMNVEK